MFSIENLTLGAAVFASLVSLYGIFQNSRWTKKQIDAEIVAKSRIEWIQQSRELTADFINAVHNLISYHPRKSINRNNDQGTKRTASYDVKHSELYTTKTPRLPKDKTLKDLKNEVHRTGNLLTLMFGPPLEKNKEQDSIYINDLIVEVIQNLISKLTNNRLIADRALSNYELRKFRRTIKDLSQILRLYYKVEWKRATGAVSAKDINKKFKENNMYREFYENYKELIEDENDDEV